MKVNLRTIIGMLGCAAVVSCTTTTDEPDISQLPIEFGTTVNRSVVTSPDNMSSFSVWGGYDGVFLFDKTQVNKGENGWTYNGGSQYWVPGKTFNFYAVHPSTLQNVEVSKDGTITVTNFNCSKTGTEAVDLMTATANRITSNNNPLQPNDIAPVTLKFSHELAKVNVLVESAHSKVTVTGVKLNGVGYSGDLEKNTNESVWKALKKSTTGDGKFSSSEFVLDTSTSESQTVLQKNVFGDMLLIPLGESDLAGAELNISYKFDGDLEDRKSIVNLNVPNSINSWQAGQAYKYTVKISSAGLGITVTINEWKEENSSVTW